MSVFKVFDCGNAAVYQRVTDFHKRGGVPQTAVMVRHSFGHPWGITIRVGEMLERELVRKLVSQHTTRTFFKGLH